MKIYIYQDLKTPKIIDKKDLDLWREKGWFDTPAKIEGVLKKFNVSPGDDVGVQEVGSAIEGVKDRLNGFLNLDLMPAKQLRKFAKKHFGQEYKKGTRCITIIKELKAKECQPLNT